MVIVVALGWMSMLNAALLATGAMLLTVCLTFQGAGNSIAFTNLVIIASAIGLESAVSGKFLGYSQRRLNGDSPRLLQL
jgi:multisubunit Na+/H+ antiporter MnhB subunit